MRRSARGWWALAVPWAALLLLLAGCPEDDDDIAGDDDAGDDDAGDDDTTPTVVCTEAQASAELDGTICANEAACWFGDIGSSYYQGFALATGGDFDGDGQGDLLVGAPGYDLTQDDGRVAIYTAASFAEVDVAPVAMATGQQPLENVGYAVAFAGDVDGDGLDDVLAGARNEDQIRMNARAADLALPPESLARLSTATGPLRAHFAGALDFWRPEGRIR